MELSWLQDFLALAETGNFSRASARRYVTQPGLSRRIRALEEWVGAALFDRGTQPVALTEAGRHFMPAALEVTRRLQAAREETRAVGASGSGLNLAATHVLSFSFLPAWLRRLEVPQLQLGLNLVSDHLQACEQAMLDRQVQFLLCHRSAAVQGRLDRAGFTAVRIGTDRLSLVAAPGGGTGELAYSASSGLGRIVAGVLGRDPRQRSRPVFTSHLAEALRSMAKDGRGVAWLPESLIEEDLRLGRLVRQDAHAIEIEIVLIRPEERLDASAERFWHLAIAAAAQ